MNQIHNQTNIETFDATKEIFRSILNETKATTTSCKQLDKRLIRFKLKVVSSNL